MMVIKNQGVDISLEIGGIATLEMARSLFEKKMDAANLSKIMKIQNAAALLKIANAISMCEPDAVFVNTGSELDKLFVRSLALQKGEETLLAMDHGKPYPAF
ncbi:MAG: hypothetical protein NTU74_17180 [Deltaproteobacteria bacterium]|nr:hypothetical protein [Deltaproteobacteria bacterium]